MKNILVKDKNREKGIKVVEAWCHSCDWHSNQLNAHLVGAKHAKKHGHDVVVQVTFEYSYEYSSGVAK